ncbi:MAG: hypothetical protein K6E96_08625 [Bacteroidales bacterium]|jgi:hypothetical protein|nr:hypothetical protein [Bacteroidales bacterium]
MKRILVAWVLLMVGGTVWAQTDSVAVGRVLGDEPQVRRSHERNVLGAPVYYDTLGNVIGRGAPADSFYHRPKHHFRNRLEDDFCSVFLEGQTKLGRDIALGAQLAWVPQRWGIYGSGCISRYNCDFSVGPVWRMSDCGNWIDWQLYGGLAFSYLSVGAEMGVRMASPKLWGDFCWTSFSLTVGRIHQTNYVALGLSLTLTSIVAITIW